jgi:hypothetical protein
MNGKNSQENHSWAYDSKQAFSDKQFGFISGRSTTLQLLIVMEEWTEILDNGGTLDSIYNVHGFPSLLYKW